MHEGVSDIFRKRGFSVDRNALSSLGLHGYTRR